MRHTKPIDPREALDMQHDFIRKAHPFVEIMNYDDFKTHVKPILSTALSVERRFIYHDPEIPSESRKTLERIDLWGKVLSGAVTLIVPWVLGRYVACFAMRRSLDLQGLSMFNRWVMMSTAAMYIPLFPATKYLGDHMPSISVSQALTIDSNNDQLAEYRKRLFDARPDLMGARYIISRMRETDGVELPVVPEESKGKGRKKKSSTQG